MCISHGKTCLIVAHFLLQDISICSVYFLDQDRTKFHVHNPSSIIYTCQVKNPLAFLKYPTFDIYCTNPCVLKHCIYCIIPVPPNTLCVLYHSCTTRHSVCTVSFLNHPTLCVYCIIPIPPSTPCVLYHSCTTQHSVCTVSFLYHPTLCVYCIIPVPPGTLCVLYHSCTTQHSVCTISFLNHPTLCVYCIISVPRCELYHSCTT